MTKRQIKLGAIFTGVGGPGHHYRWLDPEIPGDASINIRLVHRTSPASRKGQVRPRLHRRQPVHHRRLPAALPEPPRAAHAAVRTRHGNTATSAWSARSPRPTTTLSTSPAVWRHWTSSVAAEPAGTSSPAATPALQATSAVRSTTTTTPATGEGSNLYRSPRAFGTPTKTTRSRATERPGPSWTSRASTRSTTRASTSRSSARSTSHAPRRASRSSSRPATPSRAATSGATIGEGIFTHAASLEEGQAFYDDIKSTGRRKGTQPRRDRWCCPGSACSSATPMATLARSNGRASSADHDFDRALAELGRPFGWHDFRQYDLDAPFPDVLHVARASFRTQAEKIVALARDNNFTLRADGPAHLRSQAHAVRRLAGHGRQRDAATGSSSGRSTATTSTSTIPTSSAASSTRCCRSCASEACVRSEYEVDHPARQPGPADSREPLHAGPAWPSRPGPTSQVSSTRCW